MARRAKASPRKPAGEAAPADEVDEVAVLFPDVEVTVTDPETGEPVALTVREFRFAEGLRAQALARPLIAALAALAAREAAREGAADIDALEIQAAIGEHGDLWLDLAALATGREASWLGRLRDADAQEVTAAMWQANALFLMRRAVARVLAPDLAASALVSLASWMRSSEPATDAATPSSATH